MTEQNESLGIEQTTNADADIGIGTENPDAELTIEVEEEKPRTIVVALKKEIGIQRHEIDGLDPNTIDTAVVSYISGDNWGTVDTPLELEDVTVTISVREGGIDVEVESHQLPESFDIKAILPLK